jgi:hypothetical protein
MMDDDAKDVRAGYVYGFPLLTRQMRGLLWKRYLNWRRDAWSILIQLVVPVLFFVLALYMARLKFDESTVFENIAITRGLLGNRPTIISSLATDAEATAVTAQWDAGTTTLRPFEPMLSCSCNCPHKGQTGLFSGMECCMYDFAAANASAHAAGMGADVATYCAANPAGSGSGQTCASSANGMDVQPGACEGDSVASFDGYLWRAQEELIPCKSQKTVGCDALHIGGYDAAAGRYTHTIYTHQSAYHSLPATANSANSAILRQRSGKPGAGIQTTNEWLPPYNLYKSGDVVDNENDTTLITSLFVVMGASILTASMAVFPVYERRNNSKHLQMVSGINKVAYWICHWVADLGQMMLPLAAIIIIFAAFNIDQYKGQLGGVFVLVLCFILSSIPYSHLIGFYFNNEFYAFVGQVGMNLFLGIITTATGVVVDELKNLNDDTKLANNVLKNILPLLLPHYSLGKGLVDIGQNKLNGSRLEYNAETQSLQSIGVKDWWHAKIIGDDIGFLIGMGVFYAFAVLALELSEGSLLAGCTTARALNKHERGSTTIVYTARLSFGKIP